MISVLLPSRGRPESLLETMAGLLDLAEPKHFERRVLPAGYPGSLRDGRPIRVRLEVGRAGGNTQLATRGTRRHAGSQQE